MTKATSNLLKVNTVSTFFINKLISTTRVGTKGDLPIEMHQINPAQLSDVHPQSRRLGERDTKCIG